MNTVLVIAAHPDDETLGCGGTVARHVDAGDHVKVIFVSDGVSSREDKITAKSRQAASRRACQILGAEIAVFFDFPDNQLDTVPLIEIVKKIENKITTIRPRIVYTHHPFDLNVDHSLVYRAVMTACRPQPPCSVEEIYTFEIPSSSDWLPFGGTKSFTPNLFVDISTTISKKLAALSEYDVEMRPFPHSRSYENIENLARFRGATVGLEAAEGFVVERILRR